MWGDTAWSLLEPAGAWEGHEKQGGKDPPLLSLDLQLPGTEPGSKYLCFTDGESEAREQEAANLHGRFTTPDQIAHSLPLLLASSSTRVSPKPSPASLPRKPAQNGLPGTPTPQLTLKKPGEALADLGMRLGPRHTRAEEVWLYVSPRQILTPSAPSIPAPSCRISVNHAQSWHPKRRVPVQARKTHPPSSLRAPRAQVTCALPNLPQGTSLGHSSVSRVPGTCRIPSNLNLPPRYAGLLFLHLPAFAVAPACKTSP